MFKILFLTILATTILIASTLSSAEVIPIWMNIWKQGSPQFTNRIHDFEFLRGEDQFIMIAGVEELGAIDIRETLTGELVRSMPLPTASYFNQLEITPDSNRFVITTGGDKVNNPTIELRNVEDLSIVNIFTVRMDDDSVDPKNQPYYFVFKDIVIDPVKPYIYAFITKTNYYDDDDDDRTWLKVYNYETMEEIRDLPPDGYEYELMKCMDISDDGRQLAVLNEGKAYLKVWNTETFELTIDKQLFDDNYTDIDDYWCKVGDIEFSSINPDLIYISGGYPNKNKSEDSEYSPYGFHKFSILTDSFHKDYIGPNQDDEFILFDNEERVLLGKGRFVVLNQKINKQEIYIISDTKYPTGNGNLYSKKNRIFIGKSSHSYSAFRYDSQTSIESEYEDEITISPNPTNSFINISIVCQESTINYQINNSSGTLISQNTIANDANNLRLDFSGYPSGVYFLTIDCNIQSKTYKIIKEG